MRPVAAETTCDGDAELSTNGGPHRQWLALVLGLTAGYLYMLLFSLSGVAYFRTGDEDFFWTYAYRVLSGQVFLRDFHQFTPPGTEIIYSAFFRLFGVSMSTINWTIFCLGLALALSVFCCARFILRPSGAALAGLFAVMMLFGDRLDATHHWFSSVANLCAVLMVLPRRTYLRIAAAGAVFAFAAFCTQTRGAAGLVACCLAFLWERRRGEITRRVLSLRITLLVAVTFFVWLALSWRFIEQAGLANYWYAQVVYLPKDANFPVGFLIPPFAWSNHPSAVIQFIDRLAMYLMLLSVCPWIAIQSARGRYDGARAPFALFLLASLGIMQTFEVITALNWNRIAAVALPAAILAIYLVDTRRRSRDLLLTACWSLLAVVAIAKCFPQMLHRYARVQLPTGPVLAQNEDAEQLTWLARHTLPGDAFFEVANTRLYALLQLRNPTPIDLLSAQGYTLASWVDEAVRDLDLSRTRYVLWSERSGIGSVERRHTAASDHLDPLRAYLQRAYTHAWTFANGDQIWERRDLPCEF